MEIINTKAHLKEYLDNNKIPIQGNKYTQYELLLKNWKQENLPEKDSLKKRIKDSFLWSVLKLFLPVYRVIKQFLWNLIHLGPKKAFQTAKTKLLNLKCFRLPRNKRYLESILPDVQEQEYQRQESSKWNIKISILVPLHNTPERYLRDLIGSVQAQTYEKWQLCMADGSDGEHGCVEDICKEYQKQDDRICYQRLEKNTGIAGNTNACIAMAEGEYIAFFDHDDLLHPSVLYECMKVIWEKQAEFVYTDELTFMGDNLNDIVTRHYKPDFSPENLRGVNYICHFSIFKKSLLEKTGLLDDAYDGSQDHDIILKLTSAAECVKHIPKILYFWRVHPGSVSMDIGAKEYAIEAGRKAVRDQEMRLGRETEVFSTAICATHYRLQYKMKENPLVSIVVTGDSGEYRNRLLSSIYANTSYENYEIIWSKELPAALEGAGGAFLVFLEEDMEIAMPDWIQMLLMYVQREDVGIAAGRILSPSGAIREAGYITGLDKEELVVQIGAGEIYSDLGYMGRMYYTNNVSACSLNGAMIKAETAKELLQERVRPAASARYRGLAVSEAVQRQGKTIVINPYAVFVKEQEEQIGEEEREWAKGYFSFEQDPYYNPNLSRDGKFQV